MSLSGMSSILDLYNYTCVDLCYEELKSELLPLCSLDYYYLMFMFILFSVSFGFLFFEKGIKNFADRKGYNFNPERFLKTIFFLNAVISLIFIVASVKFSFGLS